MAIKRNPAPDHGYMDESRFFLICVDTYQGRLLKGRLRNSELGEERCFDNLLQLLLVIEAVLDSTGYPQHATLPRRFRKAQSPQVRLRKTEKPEQGQPGQSGNFGLKVLFRQHAGWQGVLTWLDQEREEDFRSVWELLLLLDSALAPTESGCTRPEEAAAEGGWDSGEA